VRPFSRRVFLGGAGALATGALLGTRRVPFADAGASIPSGSIPAALSALGRSALRGPDSLPNPGALPGTPDPTLANIEHIVVLMLENHSYDNVLGVLPPVRRFSISGRVTTDRLNGLSMDDPSGHGPSWNPYGVTNTNPYTNGTVLSAFLMPGTCQLQGKPSQEWAASHAQYAGGTNQGFALSPSGPVAMGYWDGSYLPFTYALASTFPVGDQWFCSVLGQTDPNRRYLIAATSSGMTDDIALPTSLGGVQGLSPGTIEQDALLASPANGTIFDRLTAYGISWADYNDSYPTGTTAELYPFDDAMTVTDFVNNRAFGSPGDPAPGTFFGDCRTGSLPQFSLLDPNYSTQSQEDPQDMAVGEAMLASVVEAVVGSPNWATTLLVITYDEHGGYYDHVPPPPALAPDAIGPVVAPGESAYDGFCRYGFRVPALVVSPYAVANGVTHVLHDHTSILAMVEKKWNLPALTFRDANANDLTDFLDMAALRAGTPTLPEPGPFPASGPSRNCPLSPSAVPPSAAVSPG
jgi:phospholipase C